MSWLILFMILELIILGSAQSDDIQSDRRQPRCKNPFGRPGHTLVKSCADKDVCTLGKNNRARWETCPLAASQDTLKAFEADVESKLNAMEVSLKVLFKQHLEIMDMLHEIIGPTTLLQSTIVTSAAPVWRKVYALNTAGGLFANLDETKKKNIDDPDADHFSILFELESMRNADRVFHFKLCYPELTQFDPPCNEWKQSSNPVTEGTITGFVGIDLNIATHFRGLKNNNNAVNLIDSGYGWWYSVGTLRYHPSSPTVPGPIEGSQVFPVKLVELSVLYNPSG